MHTVKSILLSMSKREKFYFAKYYADSKDKNFYQLYSYIESHPKADFNEWKEHFKGKTIGKNLSTELNYLYHHILRALHIYRINSKNTSLNILQNLQYIEILMLKEQYDQARKILIRTKKLAYKHEEYSILVKIISIQEELDISSIDSNLPEKLKDLEKERQQCLDYIQNYFELKILRTKLIGLQYVEGMFIHRESEHLSLFYHPLLEDISCATSKKSVDLWYFCKGMVSHLKANYLEAAKYDKTRTEYLLENDYIFSPTDIIKSLNNYIYLLIDQKNFKEAFNYINIIDTYRDNANIKKALYLYFKHYLFLRACAFSGDNESLIPFVYDSLKQLVKWKKELNTTQQNEWYFNLVIALVQIKDYKEAIKVQNQWAIAEIMEYTILWRKIYRMICFYENESFILLNSEILSSVKALKRRNLQSQTIDILLNFFRHGAKHKKKMPYRKQELYLNLLELRKLPEEHKYFLELNLLNWAKT